MQKNKAWIAAMAGIAVIVIIALVVTMSEKQTSVLTIGVTLPLSGDAAAYGKEALNGLNLAADEINARGGMGGKPIRLAVQDDQGSPKDGVSALQKLIFTNPGMQVVIGGGFSQIAAAQIPVCERNGIVLFSPFASNPDLAKPDDCFFRNWPSDTAEGKEMAEYAYQTPNLRRVAILSSNSDYGVGLRKVFEREFKAVGGTIPVVLEFAEGDSDFRPQLTRIKDEGADSIYMIGWYKEFARILRQARELAVDVQFLSCVTFNKPELLELAGEAAEGVIFSQPAYSAEREEPVVQSFVQAYEGRFGAKPGTYAAQAYDALNLISEAASQGLDADDIKRALYQIKDYPGVTGSTTFDSNGDVEKPVEFMAVRNGRYVYMN